MPLTITRIYESDITLGGLGVDMDEAHISIGSLQIGLETNAHEIRNLKSRTRLTLTQGDLTVEVEITQRVFLTNAVAYYNFELISGTIAFVDGQVVTIVIQEPAVLDATITFNRQKAISSQNIEATIGFSDTHTGLTIDDLSVNVGSISSFTDGVATIAIPTGTGRLTLTLAEDAVDEGNLETEASIEYAPFAVSWANVPTDTVDNTFPAELHASHEITDLTGSDLILRRVSGTDANGNFVNVTDAEVTVTQITGTTNYLLEFDLTGTFDGVYYIRLRPNRVMAGTEDYPDASLNSPNFTIDTDYVPPITPDAPTISVVSVDYRAIIISIVAGHDGNADITDWEYELDGDGTWHAFGSTDIEQTIPDLTPDTSYAIKVRGVNSEGAGAASDAVTGRTAALTAPDPATHLRRVSATTTELVIAWRAPSNNGGTELTSYKINVDGTVTDIGSTDTSATISGLSASETVEISVAAVNAEGISDYSDTLEATTDAEFTISTDESDIRELQRFDISIAATGAVTNFTRGDVSVSGATVNTFTENASNAYTLNVTADTGAGNIVININEDVVLPGNAPVSKSFRRRAYPIPEITFGVRQVIPGSDVPVNIDWDESVDDFDDADITVIGTGATKGNLEGSGRAYRFIIQTTPTGTGRITVRIRPNAVREGNRQKQASISYLMPPVWLTGSALESRIDALGDTRIDMTEKVSNATEIEALGGLQAWLSFDGSHLVITQAPILRKDTEFRVKLRARNDEGVYVDAFYTLTVNASKLAMLQSTLFFKPSITYEDDRVTVHGASIIVREMTDNNYETYSRESDVEINTADADGNPTTIHFIALKTKKVDRFSFMPSGGSGTGFSNRAMPTRFVATGCEDIPTVVNGYQHELYPLPDPVTATSVRMQFHGRDIEIYAVMLLELIVEIPDGDFLDILPDKVDRTGEILDFPDGGVDRANVMGAERWKWETEYILQVLPSETAFDSVPEVLKFIGDHPNIVHAEEPARHPERIYPAVQASFEISDELQNRSSGSIVPFRVMER